MPLQTQQGQSILKVKVTGLGVYVPERILSNADLEQIVETSDEWIIKRTGIRERRIAAEKQYTSDLCVEAVKNMVERYQVSVEDVDLIIVATTTPDYPMPSTACLVQAQLGIRNVGAIDLNAACAGFVYALQYAAGLITSGIHKKALVIGGETLSKVTDYTDRSTCILFGDGAGVMLVEYDKEGTILATHTGSDGREGQHLYRSGIRTCWEGTELRGNGYMVQNGREVYKWAVSVLSREIPLWLDKAGYCLEQIDWFVPHSANLRIVEAVCNRIGYPADKVLFSGEYYGNTSSATIPLAIDMAVQRQMIRSGDILLLYGFGGGLVHAGLLLRWSL